MSSTIKKITIEGFKSIRKLEDLELRAMNVLIGANGAGKSNFVSFFHLLREMIDKRLRLAINKAGGADACLYLGPKFTKQISAKIAFGNNGYEFTLVPTVDNRLIFASESVLFRGRFDPNYGETFGSGYDESKLKDHKDDGSRWGATHGVPHYVHKAVSGWVVYHFHDTSDEAGVRRKRPINDNEFLRPNAENLAAFLFQMRRSYPSYYEKIRDVVRLAAPFFDDFKLRPDPADPTLIQLEWLQRDSDYPFLPNHLSDGTLRFICMATALLQPVLPSTMLFDEPELGLHPYALTLLANLFQQAAKQDSGILSKQLIVSTQSAPLLNEFAPEDIVVVERAQGQSTFRRLMTTDLSEWLKEYTMGELWQKNVLGGRPHSEDVPQASKTEPTRA